MQLHEIKPNTAKKKKKRVGRGGKRGTYSGKGMKGQKSRAGRRIRPQIRDIIKKIPKKKGYRVFRFKVKPEVVNLSKIEAVFADGAMVTPQEMVKLNLVKKVKGKLPKVKILAQGDIKKKIIVSKCEVSEAAKEKIKKAGGEIK